jgi:DNA-directed RNA polymerase subunit RPC12/RpoP
MNSIKCGHCGKFISHKSIEENKAELKIVYAMLDIADDYYVCQACTEKEAA